MSNKFRRKERGQGLVEYAMLLTLIALVVIMVLALMGPAVGNVFSDIVAEFDALGTSDTPPTATLVPAPVATPVDD